LPSFARAGELKRVDEKRNLGFYVQEVGAVEVVKVKADVSVARVKLFVRQSAARRFAAADEQRTSPMFQQRPALTFSRIRAGRLRAEFLWRVTGSEMLGREQIVYIDLGAEDRVQIGDYLTIYRPLGEGKFV
jgi:hypothetical protein